MAHDETIRIYRSDVPGAEPPSLTYGELAANLADRKVFVGGPGGTADMIVIRETPNTGVTGISAGSGIAASGITGYVLITNTGVTSFNGLTGAVRYAPPVASNGLSGVASFLSRDFSVSNTGHVSLLNNFIDINSGSGISVFPEGRVDLGQAITIRNIGVTSFNGSTGNINLIDFVQGEWIATRSQGNKTILTNIGVTGISAGHTGISLVGTTGNVRIFNMGVHTFNGSTGHITFNPVTGNTVLAGSGIAIPSSADNTRTIINVGVTGISAGHTGIALSGTTGNVQIWNMGVLSLDGQTGHLTRGSTGDTITAGLAIGVSVVSGNQKRIDNLGVTSFNGLTGTVTMTGDGGAVVGVGNNTIRARLAEAGVTGVASFPATFFAVNNSGAVSLSGPYSVIGVTGIGFGNDAGLTGKINLTSGTSITIDLLANNTVRINSTGVVGSTGDTVAAGVGMSVVRTGGTNVVTINNLGVTSFNGLTGAVTLTGDGGAVIGTGNNRIIARLVTSGTTGVASFNVNHFSVSSSTGHVSLAEAYQATGDTVITVPGSGIAISTSGKTDTLFNIGVTGISAGHTGIALSGTTGNVQIFNMGVHTFNGSTGHITFNPATGDTITAGSGIAVSVVSGNNKRIDNIGVTGVTAGVGISVSGITGNVRINNMGVTSFNGLTGAVSGLVTINSINPSMASNFVIAITGDGGAVRGFPLGIFDGDLGIGIAARLATASLTGVASFPAAFFAVNNSGAVSLSGPYSIIGVTGVSAGHTGIALSGTTGNVQIFNMGVLSINGQTGHYTLPAAGATGDTITAGLAIGVSVVSGNNKRIDNLGVTSFNGLTGAVTLTGDGGAVIGVGNNTIRARFATESLTGVAAFPATFFAVNNGAVSLSGPYAVIGVTGISAGHTGISLIGTTGNVQIFNMGVLSLDGQTGHLTRGSTGDTITAGLAVGVSVVSGNNKRIDNLGVTSFNGLTGAVTLTGDGGAVVGINNNTIRARLAEAGVTGVASFPATFFAVNNGAVSLSGPYSIIGVTGISAGHTGIALSGTTGNVQIFNMGVHTFNGSTGHITFNPATGDTITAGLAIGVSVVSGNQKRIDNLGVTSFNGLTGAVTLTGDSGAIIGAANNIVRARLATESLTGVASFPATFFAVNNGAVSLSGPYSIIGVTGIGFGNDAGLTGKINLTNGSNITLDYNSGTKTITINSSGSVGATGDTVVAGVGISVVRSSNQATVNNMGVTSFNGLTGAITLGLSDLIAALPEQPSSGWGGRVVTYSTSGEGGEGYYLIPPTHPHTLLTLRAGNGIAITGNNLTDQTIINRGVTSFNGLTGAISGVASINGTNGTFPNVGNVVIAVTGDGGAIQAYAPLIANTDLPFGVGVRLAETGKTGVASFDSTIFNVSTTGHVTLSGSLFSVRDEISVSETLARGETLTITGGQGIDFLRTGKNNFAIRGATATTGIPGVASFLSSHFSVSSTGHVSLAAAYQATGDTVITVAGSGIAISTEGKTDTLFNIGVTGVTAGVAISVSGTTGNIRINNMGVTSFNGLTGAVTLTGDGGAIIGASNSIIRARLANETTDPPASGTTGVAAFFQDHFIVTDSGLVKLLGGGGGGGPGPFGFLNSGMGVSFAGDGSLSFAYVDYGNLSTGSLIDTTDQLVFFDENATSTVKTRKITVKNFFQDQTISDIFSTATPGQLARSKDGNVLQWSIVTSNIAAGQDGLVKGATAFAYIAQNTVKSINGQTGDIECIAVTCAAQTFTGLQTFGTGISAANLLVSGGATFNSPITTSGYRYSPSSFVTKTAGFTFGDSADDNGKVFVMNNTEAIGVTVKSGLPVGFCAEFLLVGTNRVGFEADAGVTLTMYDNIVFPPNRVQIISYAADTYLGTYAYSNY